MSAVTACCTQCRPSLVGKAPTNTDQLEGGRLYCTLHSDQRLYGLLHIAEHLHK